VPRQRAAVEEDEGPSKAWMESYADAMTLLLAFFIMMFAFALVDQEKFFDFKVGMVQALGVSDPINDDPSGMLFAGDGIAQVPGTVAISTEEVRQLNNETIEASGGEATAADAEGLRQLLEEALRQIGADEHVAVEIDERGVVIRFDDRVLFPSGSNRLIGDGSSILTQVAAVLGPIDNHISVEGHTDSVPTNGGTWPTNWELSTARATTVLRHFIEASRLPPPRLSATGYADTRPRAANTSESGRRQNRRVEVVVVIEGLLEATEPGETIDPGIADGMNLPSAAATG
jgi:chemotaxis protein MotB